MLVRLTFNGHHKNCHCWFLEQFFFSTTTTRGGCWLQWWQKFNYYKAFMFMYYIKAYS